MAREVVNYEGNMQLSNDLLRWNSMSSENGYINKSTVGYKIQVWSHV